MNQAKGFATIAYAIAGLLLFALLVVRAEAQSELRDVTFKLGGQSCDAHIIEVESALLRLKGVLMVDIEAKEGHVVIGYDADVTSTNQIIQTIKNQNGRGWFCTAEVAV